MSDKKVNENEVKKEGEGNPFVNAAIYLGLSGLFTYLYFADIIIRYRKISLPLWLNIAAAVLFFVAAVYEVKDEFGSKKK